MATATLKSPTIVARTPGEIRGCLHGLNVMARRGWLKNPRRVIGRMSEQLAARESDLETAETPAKPEPLRTDEENQLSEEELRDRNLRTSVPGKEQL